MDSSSSNEPNSPPEDQEGSYLDESSIDHEIILEDTPGEDVMEIEDDGDDDEDYEGGEGEEGEEGEDEEGGEIIPQEGPCFPEHNEPVYCVAIGPDTQSEVLIATGGGDDKVRLWTFPSYQQINVLEGHTDSVSSISFNHNKTLLASGAMDNTIRIWKISGELASLLEGPDDLIEWVDWHPQGNVILAGSKDNSCWMWNAENGSFMRAFVGHTDSVTCGGFSPDGKKVITGSADQTVKVWDPRSGNCAGTIGGAQYHHAPILSLASRDSESAKLVATGDEEGVVYVANYETGKILTKLSSHSDSVESIAFLNALPYVASASMDGIIHIWDLHNGMLRNTLSHKALADGAGVSKIKAHATEPFIYSATTAGSVHLWDCRSCQCVRSWNPHRMPILDLDVSLNGRVIVTGSDDLSAVVSLYE
eukprot:CAMPEP_0184333540 /NCGR_PEP_ID=MMETSP1089-20130417/2512_1 /TAXON_ID=38269 ORGANISM="Gloeochaete wittrockiana, Strain SAG46.84" /NCGR_SAMPLE_ID=MMETSP1089 /ASSEMBLY_ACC=CAM_ASM_000445 /LENGTH=419 /DNA_ID=CAMNT_0026657401 /DNA_START=36 /DNA_END=1295 /DNA_ORIENTATION=+